MARYRQSVTNVRPIAVKLRPLYLSLPSAGCAVPADCEVPFNVAPGIKSGTGSGSGV